MQNRSDRIIREDGGLGKGDQGLDRSRTRGKFLGDPLGKWPPLRGYWVFLVAPWRGAVALSTYILYVVLLILFVHLTDALFFYDLSLL